MVEGSRIFHERAQSDRNRMAGGDDVPQRGGSRGEDRGPERCLGKHARERFCGPDQPSAELKFPWTAARPPLCTGQAGLISAGRTNRLTRRARPEGRPTRAVSAVKNVGEAIAGVRRRRRTDSVRLDGSSTWRSRRSGGLGAWDGLRGSLIRGEQGHDRLSRRRGIPTRCARLVNEIARTLHVPFANPCGASLCARVSQRSPQNLHRDVHVFCTSRTPERHSQTRSRAGFVEAEREQHVRSLERSAGAGRTRGNFESGEIQASDEHLPINIVRQEVQRPWEAVRLRSVCAQCGAEQFDRRQFSS